MTGSIKIFLSFLAFFAIISVFSFFDIFTGVRSASFFESTKSLPPLKDDADGDGLTDSEESYWNTDFLNPDTDGDGFIDGEEVASGHDPRVHSSQGDTLKKINLTDKMAELTLSGLAEGSLKPTSPEFNTSVNLVISDLFNNYETNTYQTPPSITVVEDSSVNLKKYITTTFPVLLDFANKEYERILNIAEIVDNLGLLEEGDKTVSNITELDLSNFFLTINGYTKTINADIGQLESVGVPKNLYSEHFALVSYLKKLTADYSSLKEISSDPTQFTISYYNIIDSFSQIPIMLADFQDKFNFNQ